MSTKNTQFDVILSEALQSRRTRANNVRANRCKATTGIRWSRILVKNLGQRNKGRLQEYISAGVPHISILRCG